MRITKEKLVEIIKEELAGLDESVLGYDDWSGSRNMTFRAMLTDIIQKHPNFTGIYGNEDTGEKRTATDAEHLAHHEREKELIDTIISDIEKHLLAFIDQPWRHK